MMEKDADDKLRQAAEAINALRARWDFTFETLGRGGPLRARLAVPGAE